MGVIITHNDLTSLTTFLFILNLAIWLMYPGSLFLRFILGPHHQLSLVTLSKTTRAFNATWPPVRSIDKCCQVTSLSVERTDYHILLKASSCLMSLLSLRSVALAPLSERSGGLSFPEQKPQFSGSTSVEPCPVDSIQTSSICCKYSLSKRKQPSNPPKRTPCKVPLILSRLSKGCQYYRKEGA